MPFFSGENPGLSATTPQLDCVKRSGEHLEQAAKRRKITAHGASRGYWVETDSAPKGRKKLDGLFSHSELRELSFNLYPWQRQHETNTAMHIRTKTQEF